MEAVIGVRNRFERQNLSDTFILHQSSSACLFKKTT